MKNSEIYTSAELEILNQIENGEYVSLSKEEFKKKKALLLQDAMNRDDLKIFEQRKYEESISFESFMKTLKEL